jgi:hypothetical protein
MGIPKTRSVLLIVLFIVPVVFAHTESETVYKEFRFRIEKNSSKSAQEKAPAIAIPGKKTGVVLESRAVNIKSGLGRGGWSREKQIIVADPNDRDLEAAYINLPRTWNSGKYLVTVIKTSDNRWYWWEKDGSLHFYAVLRG